MSGIGYPTHQTAMPHATPVSPVPQHLSQHLDQMMHGAGGDDLAGYDLSGIESRSFELLPERIEGRIVNYEGVITAAELAPTSAGDRMIKYSVETTFPLQFAGVSITDYVVLKDSTLWKYKSFLKATHLLTPDGARFAGRTVKDFIGRHVRFAIKHSEYEGELRNKINGGLSHAKETPGIDISTGLKIGHAEVATSGYVALANPAGLAPAAPPTYAPMAPAQEVAVPYVQQAHSPAAAPVPPLGQPIQGPGAAYPQPGMPYPQQGPPPQIPTAPPTNPQWTPPQP